MRLGLAIVVAAIGSLTSAQAAMAEPADTVITAGLSDLSVTRDNTPTFQFAATQANVTFTCSIYTAEAVTTLPCSSPYTLPPLTDGGHKFEVSATNSVPEIDPTPAKRDFTVDTTAPNTTITSGPREGQVINTDAPAFTWVSSETGSTFACVTDGVPLTSCDLAFAAGAKAGLHTFSVAATDAAGNTDPTPATRKFTISLRGAPPNLPHCQYDGRIVVGTAAADTPIGSAGTDLMFGLGGNDIIHGRGGPDCIAGGDGNDFLYGEAGIDFLSGGAGNDRMVGGPDNDELRGGAGNDHITGSAGLDVLVGDAGNDLLQDGSGRDSFSGGAGNDRIEARDHTVFGRRASDIVRCGPGFDTAIVDKGDRVNKDCEHVVRR